MIVSWSKPNGGNEINQYYVQWYQTGKIQDSAYKYVEHIFGKVNYSFVITNLQSGIKYSVSIVAINIGGHGIYKSADIITGIVWLNLFFKISLRGNK